MPPLHNVDITNDNAFQLIAQYIEIAQSKGAYKLNDAFQLKKALDACVSAKYEPFGENDRNPRETAKRILLQGIFVGQNKGAFTISDSVLLADLIQFTELDGGELFGSTSHGHGKQVSKHKERE